MNESMPKIKEKLEDHERRISEIEKTLSQKPQQPVTKPISIKEFLLSKNPKGVPNKTLAICHFLEKYEGISPANIKDLQNGFTRAREPLSSNLNQMINENIRKGYMMEAREKKDKLKAWLITTSGEKFVESNFQEVKK